MPCIIWVLSFLRLVGSTVIFITALGMTSIESYFVEWGWLAMFIWSVSAANDLTLTVTLVVLLLKHRTTSMHTRSDF
jgi:hypothetical protein